MNIHTYTHLPVWYCKFTFVRIFHGVLQVVARVKLSEAISTDFESTKSAVANWSRIFMPRASSHPIATQ